MEGGEYGFNAFHHPTFGRAGNSLGTATFGVVSSTENASRDMQFGIKVQF